jgi:hypothetical protein
MLVLMRKWNQAFIAQHADPEQGQYDTVKPSAYDQWFLRFSDCGPQRQPIGADALPFLNQHSVAFKKTSNTGAFPSRDLFEIGANTAKALVLSTVRFATCETCGDSETAMVKPSRALSCNIT